MGLKFSDNYLYSFLC